MFLWRNFAGFLMVCLFLGMREELEKRKAEIKNEVLLHIIIWYVVVTVLAVREYEGWILGLAIVAAYIGILVELKNIAENWNRPNMYWKSIRCGFQMEDTQREQQF